MPANAPDEVKALAGEHRGSREPNVDPRVHVPLDLAWQGEPRHRIVVIGDSLSHGFQSGAVFNTDLSYGAIIAHELGRLDSYRYPRYAGRGGLPLSSFHTMTHPRPAPERS